jgi:hypothetical protein
VVLAGLVLALRHYHRRLDLLHLLLPRLCALFFLLLVGLVRGRRRLFIRPSSLGLFVDYHDSSSHDYEHHDDASSHDHDDDLHSSLDIFFRRRLFHLLFLFLKLLLCRIRREVHRYRNFLLPVRPPSFLASNLPFSPPLTYSLQTRREGAIPACGGSSHSDSELIVALAAELYGDGEYCDKSCVFSSLFPDEEGGLIQGMGGRVTITNTANSKSVTATVVDKCPGCSSADSCVVLSSVVSPLSPFLQVRSAGAHLAFVCRIDMSTGAFDSIGDEDSGTLEYVVLLFFLHFFPCFSSVAYMG